MRNFGKELILDLEGCNPKKFTRHHINKFFKGLCERIDMQPCKVSYWDYKGYPDEYKKAPDHMKGTSAVQFISTSNITIHTLDVTERVYINIFSCKDFGVSSAKTFCAQFFQGGIINTVIVDRL